MLLAFNIALTVIAFLGGWLIKTLFSRLEKLEATDERLATSINALAIALPTHYVSKEEHKGSLDAIHAVLRRIEDKMDRKVDKE